MAKRKEKIDFWKLLILISLFLSLINTYYLFTAYTAESGFEVALNTTAKFPTGSFFLAYSPLLISIVFCLAVIGFLLYRSRIR